MTISSVGTTVDPLHARKGHPRGVLTSSPAGGNDQSGPRIANPNVLWELGFAEALGKPIITLRDDSLTHPMKEVDAAALAVATDPAQVVQILDYVIAGRLS